LLEILTVQGGWIISGLKDLGQVKMQELMHLEAPKIQLLGAQ
jgi:hypothetical protein